jgi:hypothetical protein
MARTSLSVCGPFARPHSARSVPKLSVGPERPATDLSAPLPTISHFASVSPSPGIDSIRTNSLLLVQSLPRRWLHGLDEHLLLFIDPVQPSPRGLGEAPQAKGIESRPVQGLRRESRILGQEAMHDGRYLGRWNILKVAIAALSDDHHRSVRAAKHSCFDVVGSLFVPLHDQTLPQRLAYRLMKRCTGLSAQSLDTRRTRVYLPHSPSEDRPFRANNLHDTGNELTKVGRPRIRQTPRRPRPIRHVTITPVLARRRRLTAGPTAARLGTLVRGSNCGRRAIIAQCRTRPRIFLTRPIFAAAGEGPLCLLLARSGTVGIDSMVLQHFPQRLQGGFRIYVEGTSPHAPYWAPTSFQLSLSSNVFRVLLGPVPLVAVALDGKSPAHAVNH